MAMTEAEVRAWLASQGVAESVINDEAGYIAEHYADPDEDPLKVLQSSLGSFLQRTQSGGTRSDGGYNTNYDDPVVQTDYGTTPAREDSPAVGYDPGQPAIQGGVMTATTGSPVMTALRTTNAPLIAQTRAAVAAQPSPMSSVYDMGVDGTFGEPATPAGSPLVPAGLALVLLKLIGVF